MKYYLDFDRTLFRTDDFYHVQKTHPLFADYAEAIQGLIDGTADRRAVGDLLDQSVREKGIAFTPGELATFVYPDVQPFLEAFGKDTSLITFGNPHYQYIKIEGAGILPLVSELMLTNDQLKGEYLSSRLTADSDFVFVDDSVEQLGDVARFFPHARVVEIRRDGKPGEGAYPVIRSLAELQ